VALSDRFARRRRRGGPRPTLPTAKARDDIPKTGLFAEPVRVDDLVVFDTELLGDGSHRVTFRVEVRDADGRRCPDLAVEARVRGPERTATVQGTTDLFGRLRFRMAGPAGTYAIEVTDVAAFGLRWDATAGPTETSVTVP
jgi:hypothetical protein